jgi:exodeoxyribonuclease-3
VVRAIASDIAVFTEARDETAGGVIADAVGPHRARGGGTSDRDYPLIASRWPIQRSTLLGPRWAPAKWISATILPPAGEPITVVGLHLAPHVLGPFELWRWREVGALLKRMSSETGAHVVAGDFNALAPGDRHRVDRAPARVRAQWLLQAGATPRWAIRRLTNAGYVDCYRACNRATDGFTVPAWDPQVRIDYLFASATLAPALRSSGMWTASSEPPGQRSPRRSVSQLLGHTSVTSLDGHASDHLPVWADFSLG